jgi:hypothetical protein
VVAVAAAVVAAAAAVAVVVVVHLFICSDYDDQNFQLFCLTFIFRLSVYSDRATSAVGFLELRNEQKRNEDKRG